MTAVRQTVAQGISHRYNNLIISSIKQLQLHLLGEDKLISWWTSNRFLTDDWTFFEFFWIVFYLFAWFQISFISFSKERLRLQIIEPVFWFFFLEILLAFFCARIVSKYLQSLPRVSRSRFTANEPLFLFSKNVSLFIVQKSLSNHSSVHFVCFQQWTQLPQRCFKLIQSEFCWWISKIFVFFLFVCFLLQRVEIRPTSSLSYEVQVMSPYLSEVLPFFCALKVVSTIFSRIYYEQFDREIFLCW